MICNIAILLSGSGFLDGAEIREAVCTLLAIEQLGGKASFLAPDIKQHHVINHLTGGTMNEDRNVLIESARIARGDIQNVTQAKAQDFDALMIPGGFGVAKNFSTFAFDGPLAQIQSDVEKFIKQFHVLNKPIGTICISPAVLNLIIPSQVTIGHDVATIGAIEQMGGEHFIRQADEIMIDQKNKIVSTPAYMLEASLADIYKGIFKCVKETMNLIS